MFRIIENLPFLVSVNTFPRIHPIASLCTASKTQLLFRQPVYTARSEHDVQPKGTYANLNESYWIVPSTITHCHLSYWRYKKPTSREFFFVMTLSPHLHHRNIQCKFMLNWSLDSAHAPFKSAGLLVIAVQQNVSVINWKGVIIDKVYRWFGKNPNNEK